MTTVPNGSPAADGLTAGEAEVPRESPPPSPLDRPTWLLLEDGPLIACNKPAGIPTQAPGTFPSMERWVKEWLRTKYGKPGNVYLGVPHRLDRPVSGVIVFARNSKAAARLAEEFRERRVRKWYHAWVEGCPEPHEQIGLTHWLSRQPPGAGPVPSPLADPSGHSEADQGDSSEALAHAYVVTPEGPGARQAILDYRVLRTETVSDSAATVRSLVEIELHTGRMHQIRAQLAAIGCPAVGDQAYGAISAWTPVGGQVETGPSIALHAARLEIRHPIRYDQLTLTAPTPF